MRRDGRGSINQWFGRMPRRRLDFESTRDAVLHLAGVLQDPGGGVPCVKVRRSRQHRAHALHLCGSKTWTMPFGCLTFKSGYFGTASFSNRAPASLFLLNSPFILKQARVLAEGFLQEGSPTRKPSHPIGSARSLSIASNACLKPRKGRPCRPTFQIVPMSLKAMRLSLGGIDSDLVSFQ